MSQNRWRVLALALMCISLPLTLADSAGWFADGNGWQGYEIIFRWPVIFLTHELLFDYPIVCIMFAPIFVANLHLVICMWLNSMPKYLRLALWAMWIPATVLMCCGLAGLEIRLPFWLLVAAWITSGIGLLVGKDQPKMETTRPTVPI